jgi:hypothetical protein
MTVNQFKRNLKKLDIIKKVNSYKELLEPVNDEISKKPLEKVSEITFTEKTLNGNNH